MKFLLITLFVASFSVFGSCEEYNMNRLHRMTDDEYCSERDVVDAAIDTYGSYSAHKVYTPRKEDVYGDNDDSSLMVYTKKDGEKKYVRFRIKYGRCSVLSCSKSGFYYDEI